MKTKSFFGIRTWGKEVIYLTPTIYSQYSNSAFEETHYYSIEFQWILFGAGIKFSWKNKTVKPHPDLAKWHCSDFPANLADELSIISPYLNCETQTVVDFVTHFYGLDEKSDIVKEKCHTAIKYAMQHNISLHNAQHMACHNAI